MWSGEGNEFTNMREYFFQGSFSGVPVTSRAYREKRALTGVGIVTELLRENKNKYIGMDIKQFREVSKNI